MSGTIHTYDVHNPDKSIKAKALMDRSHAVHMAEQIDGYVIHREWSVSQTKTIADFRTNAED